MRQYQRHQFAPWNHPVHLVEELPLARSFGRQIQSQISLSHAKIVAVVGLFWQLNSCMIYADLP
jgi:hypothetical protein